MFGKDKEREVKQRSKSTVRAKFGLDSRVRVKHGVKDPNWKDLPIGGWAGVVVIPDRRGRNELV